MSQRAVRSFVNFHSYFIDMYEKSDNRIGNVTRIITSS